MKTNALLILIALIWGLGFVPQKFGLETMTPWGFNALRFAFGALILSLIMCLMPHALGLGTRGTASEERKGLSAIGPGFILGCVLAIAAGFQQVSIALTPIANVAFITGFYVVIVPCCLFILGKRYGKQTWLSALCALAGLALLSGYEIQPTIFGDLVALLGAFFWAFHILALAHYVKVHNAYRLALWQFIFCALLCWMVNYLLGGYFFPSAPAGYIWAAINGIVVVGIAYTLQVAVLERADPFVASVIFSLEAVFGALAAYWVFGETMTAVALFGALLMLFGGIWVQREPISHNGNN